MNFNSLGLYFEAEMAGFDGECFHYSVYTDDAPDDNKVQEIGNAINEYFKPYSEKEIYMGYTDVTNEGDKINIELDLGNVDPNHENTAINGILKAINTVKGIKKVIVNEDCDDFDFDF